MASDKNYWLTPPELYAELKKEFNFDFDPCPFPMVQDATKISWGSSNYVNPPFLRKDGSPTAIIRKAIEEQQLGKTSVVILPCYTAQRLLYEAKAEIRSIGRVKWLSTIDGTPTPSPNHCALYILRGKL